MSERLTERNANGTAKSRKSPKSSYMGTVYEEMAEIQTEILNRLCDLEDKIEQGKIVELPCAGGRQSMLLQPIVLQEWCKDECIRQGYAMPRADAVEVRHGQWVEQILDYGEYMETEGFKCSVCGYETMDNDKKYCSECGAKMDGEKQSG